MNKYFFIVISFFACMASANNPLAIADISSSEFKGEEIKIEKIFVDNENVLSLIRKNTYAKQDYRYFISFFSDEEKLIPLKEIPNGSSNLIIGNIIVNEQNNILLPVAYENVYIVYSYDQSKKSLSVSDRFETDLEIQAVQCREKYCGALALNNEKLIFLTKEIARGTEPDIRQLLIGDKTILSIKDFLVSDKTQFLLEVKDKKKKYLGLYGFEKGLQLSEEAAFENYTDNKRVKILKNTRNNTYVLFEYLIENSYLKNISIYSISKNKRIEEKNYNIKSPAITVFECKQSFGAVGYSEGKSDSLILKINETDAPQTIPFHAGQRRLLYDLQAYQAEGKVYLGMVYNEIRDYESHMTFAVKQISLNSGLACK